MFWGPPHPASPGGDFPSCCTAPSCFMPSVIQVWMEAMHSWKISLIEGRSWNSIHQQMQSPPHRRHPQPLC